MTKLTHSSFPICLFQFSTCYEQPRAHHQENKLYQYNIWYVSLCVGDCLVCSSGRNFPTCILDGQSDTYQMLYWYNLFSWWWARGCSKHVENWNKHIERNCASNWSFKRIIPRWQQGQQNTKLSKLTVSCHRKNFTCGLAVRCYERLFDSLPT
jgi:hypothetical protein